MVKSSKLFVLLFSLTFTVGAVGARAADDMKEHKNGPCKDDIQKFCKDVKPGGGRIVECLKAHENDLSAACKSHGEKMKNEVHEAMAACKDDVQKLCKDVKPGEGRVVKCLKEHEKDLSAGCKAEHEKLKEEHKAARAAHGK